MSEWWEVPYKGGPMVAVKGFPRPLYPTDVPPSSGHKPSSRGPDVIAYKRTVSRLGRWPWQPYDDGYWSDFAHGTPGHGVETSGVAGVQYQQDLDATGWLGKKTFQTLRSARVPEGRPHSGEMAMDGVAVDLINDAWDLFQGHELATPQGGTVRAAALKRAQGQIGVKESPPDSNDVKFCDWYGMRGPWCAMFVTWCFELGADDVGKDSPAFVKGSRYAYVPYIVGDARNKAHGLKVVSDPEPGDVVCYDWAFDGEHDHVGIFEKWVSGNDFQAIEGNTSTSNNSNGGEVMRRTRSQAGQGTVFVRVLEP